MIDQNDYLCLTYKLIIWIRKIQYEITKEKILINQGAFTMEFHTQLLNDLSNSEI